MLYLIEETYRLYTKYFPPHVHVKVLTKGFCPLPAILVSGERFNAELIWRELTGQKGASTGCSSSDLERTRQEYAL